MLILDKKEDILTLKSFGATQQQIQSIFFNKSMLTILAGASSGLLIGIAVGFLQKTFGFIGMGGGNFVIDAYPISFSILDVLLVFSSVIFIGLLASWYPSIQLTKRLFRK
jgi:lipoprotein-releasing system permease protein